MPLLLNFRRMRVTQDCIGPGHLLLAIPSFRQIFGGGKSTKLRDGCLSRSCLPVPAQRGHTEPSTQGDAKTMSRTTNCGWDRRIFSSGAMQTYISFSVLRRK
jgi:hypothetical protein